MNNAKLYDLCRSLTDDDYEYMLDFFDNIKYNQVVEYWHKRHFSGVRDFKVTPTSIKLVKKIYKNTGILLFPIINRTYAKKILLSRGAFSYFLFDEGLNIYGCCDTVGSCLKNSNELELFISRNLANDIEILCDKKR